MANQRIEVHQYAYTVSGLPHKSVQFLCRPTLDQFSIKISTELAERTEKSKKIHFDLLINDKAVIVSAHRNRLYQRRSNFVSIMQNIHPQTRTIWNINKTVFR